MTSDERAGAQRAGRQWAELRQVGFAALDHASAVRTATDLLALGPGFGDPLLAAMGLADFTAPVGTSPASTSKGVRLLAASPMPVRALLSPGPECTLTKVSSPLALA